jgi:hypothetical protein
MYARTLLALRCGFLGEMVQQHLLELQIILAMRRLLRLFLALPARFVCWGVAHSRLHHSKESK